MDYATEESLIDLFFLEILGITRRSKHVLQHFLSDLKCLQIYEHCESSIWYDGFKRFLKDCNFKQLH